MGDGWETARRRVPGNEWIIIRLGRMGILERLEIDTAHFKGNFPSGCTLQWPCRPISKRRHWLPKRCSGTRLDTKNSRRTQSIPST